MFVCVQIICQCMEACKQLYALMSLCYLVIAVSHLVMVALFQQVLDEADTMFDRGFGPDIRKFLAPLKNRASKSDDQGFQTVLVTATMTKVS